MELTQSDDQFSVSDQVTEQDISAPQANSVQILICNRPDDQSKGQPTVEAISAAAKAAGIEFVDIPLASGQANIEHSNALADILYEVGEHTRTAAQAHALNSSGNMFNN